MKRIIVTFFAITAISVSMMAMSTSRIKDETRFLTDKMAYELGLSDDQYNDTYEINYDFIYNISNIMDYVVIGDEDALEQYYGFLDTRNDDLRWVLSDKQYRKFLKLEYFYRPVSTVGSSWGFRVYNIYPNHLTFYFGKPVRYNTYFGGHYRTNNNNVSYYCDRYDHNVYRGNYQTRNERVYVNNRRSDFGITTDVNRSNGRSDSRRTNDDMYNVNRSSNSNGTSTSRRTGYGDRSSSTDQYYRRNNESTPNGTYNRQSTTTPSTDTYRRSSSEPTSRRSSSESTPSSTYRPSTTTTTPSTDTYRRSNSESTSRRSSSSTPSSTYTRPASTTTTTPSTSTSRRSSNTESDRTSTSRSESGSRR